MGVCWCDDGIAPVKSRVVSTSYPFTTLGNFNLCSSDSACSQLWLNFHQSTLSTSSVLQQIPKLRLNARCASLHSLILFCIDIIYVFMGRLMLYCLISHCQMYSTHPANIISDSMTVAAWRLHWISQFTSCTATSIPIALFPLCFSFCLFFLHSVLLEQLWHPNA